MEGNSPKWRPAVGQVYKGGTAPCQSEEEEPWDGSDLTILFQEVCLLSLSLYRRGLQDMLKIRKPLLHRLKERR